MNQHAVVEGRSRLIQVFRYLEALQERRNPPVRTIAGHAYSLYLDDVPQHACTDIRGEAHVLKVRRPTLTPCPPLPEVLRDWVQKGYEEPVGEPAWLEVLPVGDGDEPERFEDDEERLRQWSGWIARWREWAPLARTERRVERIYQGLYEQHSLLERDGERYELLLGDGCVRWRMAGGEVDHPLLLQAVELTFDAPKAEFTVAESLRPVEFYTGPLRSDESLSRTLADARKQLQENPEIHPMEEVVTEPFLRGLVQSFDDAGRYVEDRPEAASDVPQVYRNPVLFRRSKTAGMAQAVRQVLDDLNEEPAEGTMPGWAASPPEGLIRFVGVETRPDEDEDKSGGGRGGAAEEDERTYFTKPANHEQHQIVRKLDLAGCVLVQGPPGTGKTHTIANLIGHLLAEGKSVLVTSHTTKALSVLADKVVEPLRPLCVSVLESDRANRDRLEASVQAIAEGLSTGRDVYDRQSVELREVRSSLLARLGDLRSRLAAARRSEYNPIAYRGAALAPIEAAREVARDKDTHGWIPGRVSETDHLPLTVAELLELYESNLAVSKEDEANYPDDVPELGVLLSPDDFEDSIMKLHGLRAQDTRVDASLLSGPATGDEGAVAQALERIDESLRFLSGDEGGWKRLVVDLARRGEGAVWSRLADDVEALVGEVLQVEETILRYGPRWTVALDPKEATASCLEIEEFLGSGKRLGKPILILKPKWKKTIESLEVADGAPSEAAHFAAGRHLLAVGRRRGEFVRVWNGRMAQVGGPSLPDASERPERQASAYVPDIRSAVLWQSEVWPTVEAALSKTGLSLANALLQTPPSTVAAGEIDRLVRSMDGIVRPGLLRMRDGIRLKAGERDFAEFRQTAGAMEERFGALPLVRLLAQAVEEEDPKGYRLAYASLRAVFGKASAIVARREHLRRLAAFAPEWAQAIRLREGVHGGKGFPGDPEAAWRWKRIVQELEDRAKVSIQELTTQIASVRAQSEARTQELVAALSWGNLVRQTSITTRMALTGYVGLLRAIGKGTGRRAPRLILEAQKKMAESQRAVPVWIMPLTRVAESFNVGKTKFDVVIVDEASQLDLTGLLAMYMAKQVIIVGDDKQVEPLDVGTNLETAQALIDEHLDGIPSNQLWDGKRSVYGLADGPFEPIRLREHFRCVPDIIRYSNMLSYEGKILPLREEAGVATRPFVVPFYVAGATEERRVNRKEAESLVALLKACTEQPEYMGKTFGVIHMVGEDGDRMSSPQNEYVRKLARVHLGEVALEEMRFRCGNSAQFQGDERDVMFLSVVDAPGNGPLRRRTEELFKKRYNVAASRARDQMWVLYSLDPNVDLQTDDLRRGLITFSLDPKAGERLYEEKVGTTESDFEERVLQRLIDAGYHAVEPQYKVGAYRLDFAIRQGGLRVAIECDGEQFHGRDRLEEDLARQATLERLGWKFVRIRGSEFYRDMEGAMARVFEALRELGVKTGVRKSADASEGSELLERVKARAAALLAEWRGETTIESAAEEKSWNEWQPDKDEVLKPASVFVQDSSSSEIPPSNSDYRQLLFDVEPNEAMAKISEVTISAAQKPHLVFETRSEGGLRELFKAKPTEAVREAILQVLEGREETSRARLLDECAQMLTGVPLNKEIRSLINKSLLRMQEGGKIRINYDWTRISKVK